MSRANLFLKIGDLAKRSGLTVRTLHHYDAIDLLKPSERDHAGARLYGKADLVRLHHIQALKSLGYALPDIRTALAARQANPVLFMQQQIGHLRRQAQQAQELADRLQHLVERVDSGSETAFADWLNLLEMMTMYQKHLTPSEMQTLRQPDGSTAAELAADWTALVAEVDQAIAQHLAQTSPQAHALAWRWVRMVIAMTRNDPVLATKLKALQEREPRAQEILGIDRVKFDWIGQTIAHARTQLFAKYLSPQETEELRQRQLRHADDWPALVAQVRQQMDARASITAPAVQALMRHWQQLFKDAYCGDNRAMETKVRQALAQEPELMLGVGVTEELMGFVYRAMTYLHRPEPSQGDIGPKPSAHAVAVQRAVHQLLDQPLVLDDPLALQVLDPADASAIRANPQAFDNPMARGLRSGLVVRSRLAEDLWAQAAAHGVTQCVVLGAGLDTLAYRSSTPGTYFEVDLPSTQAWKRQRLQSADITPPARLHFVPVDFETTSLSQGLSAAGFRFDQPAFFVWLGVVMYLSEDAITDTLNQILRCAPGSGVVFDYALPMDQLPPMLRAPRQLIMDHLAKNGEPWKSFFAPEDLLQKLQQLGFTHTQDFAPAQLNPRYLGNRTDGLHLSGVTHLAWASTTPAGPPAPL